jgi:hypothetical protein
MREIMEHWWTDTEGEKPEYSEENVAQCQSTYGKSRDDRPKMEPRRRSGFDARKTVSFYI